MDSAKLQIIGREMEELNIMILGVREHCPNTRKTSVRDAKTSPKADCGSNLQLLIAKLELKLKTNTKKTLVNARTSQATKSRG